jgi:CAAX protease family protein
LIETIIGHVLFLVLLAAPFQAVKGLRILDRLVLTSRKARLDFYRAAIISQWVLAPAALVATLRDGPSAAASGLILPQMTLETLALTIVIGIAILSQSPIVPAVRTRMERSDQARRLLYPMRNLLPRTDPERRRWVVVALTAGFCEELLFRGFLFYYLQAYWGASLYAAVVISSLFFTFSHWYQGNANMLRVGLVGLLLGILYAATESLFFPVVLHVLLDLGALNRGGRIASDDAPAAHMNTPDEA